MSKKTTTKPESKKPEAKEKKVTFSDGTITLMKGAKSPSGS